MSFEQYGDPDYVFGIDDPEALTLASITGLKPETISISSEPEFTAEGKGVDGMTEAFAVGDDKHAFTMSGYLVDEALFKAVKTFQFDDKLFIITGRKVDKSNVAFQKAEFTGVSFSKIES